MQQVEVQLKKFKEKKGIDTATDIDKQLEEIDKLSDEKQKEITQLREQQQNMLGEEDKNMDLQKNKIKKKKKKEKKRERENAGKKTKKKKKKFFFLSEPSRFSFSLSMF